MIQLIQELAPTAIGIIVATISFIYMGINRADKIKTGAWQSTIESLQRNIAQLEEENKRLIDVVNKLEAKLEKLGG